MHVISDFPITKRWPPAYPDRLQLYSLPTPNGVKVSIMLEEIGLPYEPHLVDFNKGDQKTPEFLQKQTCAVQRPMYRLVPIADIENSVTRSPHRQSQARPTELQGRAFSRF